MKPSADSTVLRKHGTRLFDLTPGMIITAAERDLKMAAFNAGDDVPPYCPYAFHRRHVRRARDPLHLIEIALDDLKIGRKSPKPNTSMIYRNRVALRKARTELRARRSA